MNELFSGTQKMDVSNLNIIEEKVILIKESFEKLKAERDRLIAELKSKDNEIHALKDKIAINEAENDQVIEKIDSILNSLETIRL